jgi:hypothetical protein
VAAQDQISGGTLAAISRELVRLDARQYAHGGTEAKVYLCDDWLFCLFQSGTATVERTSPDRRFSALVEELTGHLVLGYISQVTFDPDLAIEIFLLGREPSS